jgi:hypothetical protein
VLEDVNRRITADMNMLLIALFSREEVKNALFSIEKFKSPPPLTV